jgi:broad specificity phosphatase PhoE
MSIRITFLRHGKADTTLPDHRLHPLSEEGAEQARQRRKMLGNPKYDLVLHSALCRTTKTAMIVAGLEEGDETFVIKSLFREDSDPRIAAINKVFDELGHAPLEKYKERIKEELESLAVEMKADVWNWIVGAFCCGDQIRNVLIVGHGVFLPALCHAFTGRVSPYADDILGECEGYELEATDMRRVDLVRSLK